MLPRKYWDDIGEDWCRRTPQRCWRAYSDTMARELVATRLPLDKLGRLLKTDAFDEAVAAGVVPFLRGHGAEVTAVDLSTQVLSGARTRYPGLPVAAADVRCLPFPNESFDTVLSFSTLDHFDARDDLGTALREIHRVMARRGRLLLTIDNEANPVVWLRNRLPYGLLKRLGLVPYRVGRTCRSSLLGRELMDCGFRIRSVSHVLHCPRVAAVAVSAMVDRLAGETGARRLHQALNAFEVLARMPTSALTGYYIALLAEKPN